MCVNCLGGSSCYCPPDHHNTPQLSFTPPRHVLTVCCPLPKAVGDTIPFCVLHLADILLLIAILLLLKFLQTCVVQAKIVASVEGWFAIFYSS